MRVISSPLQPAQQGGTNRAGHLSDYARCRITLVSDSEHAEFTKITRSSRDSAKVTYFGFRLQRSLGILVKERLHHLLFVVRYPTEILFTKPRIFQYLLEALRPPIDGSSKSRKLLRIRLPQATGYLIVSAVPFKHVRAPNCSVKRLDIFARYEFSGR